MLISVLALGDLFVSPVLWSVAVIVVGIACLVRPEQLWRLTESWKTNSGSQCSPLYVKVNRIAGVVMIVLGIGLVIYHFNNQPESATAMSHTVGMLSSALI